jgi:hypothetical protein
MQKSKAVLSAMGTELGSSLETVIQPVRPAASPSIPEVRTNAPHEKAMRCRLAKRSKEVETASHKASIEASSTHKMAVAQVRTETK